MDCLCLGPRALARRPRTPFTLGSTVQALSSSRTPTVPGAAAAGRATQDRVSGARPRPLDPLRLLPRCGRRRSGQRPAAGAAMMAMPSCQRRRQNVPCAGTLLLGLR
eukprot:scaffold16876_cov119-Isochrysis_galbana.AAC.3